MPDRRIVRYLPGGKTIVLGLKPADATTTFTYTPIRGVCSVSYQPKNAKELIPFNNCNQCPICITENGGSFADDFTFTLDGNGDGTPLDSGNALPNVCD